MCGSYGTLVVVRSVGGFERDITPTQWRERKRDSGFRERENNNRDITEVRNEGASVYI